MKLFIKYILFVAIIIPGVFFIHGLSHDTLDLVSSGLMGYVAVDIVDFVVMLFLNA